MLVLFRIMAFDSVGSRIQERRGRGCIVCQLNVQQSEQNLVLLRNVPLYETFLVNLWAQRCDHEASYARGVVPMRMRTVEAIKMLKTDIRPDVIYIDAGHHFEDVLADVDLCYVGCSLPTYCIAALWVASDSPPPACGCLRNVRDSASARLTFRQPHSAPASLEGYPAVPDGHHWSYVGCIWGLLRRMLGRQL
jgi:hypothetical protein